MTPPLLASANAFRLALYRSFPRRGDALFALLDALRTVGPCPSVAHLRLAASQRRGWGSLSAARTEGDLTPDTLRDLLAQLPLADGQPISAVAVRVGPRGDAETSAERGYYAHPSRHSAGQPRCWRRSARPRAHQHRPVAHPADRTEGDRGRPHAIPSARQPPATSPRRWRLERNRALAFHRACGGVNRKLSTTTTV